MIKALICLITLIFGVDYYGHQLNFKKGFKLKIAENYMTFGASCIFI